MDDNKKIIIKINKHTGSVQAEGQNFQTNDCEQAMNFLKNIFINQETENKPEYYQDNIVEVQQNAE